MKYTVRNLRLNRDISLPAHGPAPDGTTALFRFSSLVKKGDLEPEPANHLTGGETTEKIPAGNYLFTQGYESGSSGDADRSSADGAETDGADETAKLIASSRTGWQDAAEAVWLESLWQEREFADDQVIVRVLEEEGRRVFQIFRKVRSESSQP